jgi:predicted metal-dependent hydrolase
LLNWLNEGLLTVTRSIETHNNDNDILRKKRLENAITYVEVYRDQLANVDSLKWDLNNLLDKCAPARGVLESIRKERIDALKTGPDQKSLPLARPLEDDNLQGA